MDKGSPEQPPASAVETETEGQKLYREITESLHDVLSAADRHRPKEAKHSYSVFVGSDDREKKDAALSIKMDMDGPDVINLDLHNLPTDRSLRPHFEVSPPLKRAVAELNLRITELKLKAEQQRIKIAITVKTPTTAGDTIITPEYFLNPDGTLQRNEDDKATTARGLKMRDKEIPLILTTARGYLGRAKETIDKEIAQEQAKKKNFI